MPPFANDYITAKNFTLAKNNFKKIVPLNNTFPTDEKEYQSHIEYIQKYFPNNIMLLLQQNNTIMDMHILKKYCEYGITKFCVGSLLQAQYIKELLPEAEVTGSITMKIMPTDNFSLYKHYFNNFVLWFPYNRDIQLIKQLPQNFKYILLINCFCSKECSGSFHWLAKSSEDEDKIIQLCPNAKRGMHIQNSIYIPPQHLPLFEPYIYSYKLQGREYPTVEIIQDIVKYTAPLEKLNLYENRIPLTAYNL